MLAWSVHEYGHYKDVLRWGEFPQPRPGKGQALIRVGATTISFSITLRIAGKYQVRDPLPFVPGSDVAGTVIETGPGSPFRPGQRLIGGSAGTSGAFTELALLGEEAFELPAAMSDTDAVALFNGFQTSYLGLVERGQLKAGEWLLVHGAAGGVGTAAIQVGKVVGAKVIATASTPEKLEVCRQCGADHVINYAKDDFVAEVKRLTGGRGVDVVFDPVGGDVFDQSTSCIAWGGRIVTIGFTSGRIPEIAVNRILVKVISVVGMYMGSYRANAPERVREAQRVIFGWYEAGRIRPVVSQVLPMTELVRAFELIETRRAIGKIVLVPAT
ncbi:MAG: NADPH:quinone oxidoreductase family protein [Candidatus Lambdaproteobacteria bacterium]|nr:NADPH:quinone oxidoreductase family protein [Candidatus Lambdaproteobacteria bacterium]